MAKKDTAEFELTMEQLEVLLYILMDWRRMKSEFVEYAEYPNRSATATKLIHMFHSAWESLHRKRIPN